YDDFALTKIFQSKTHFLTLNLGVVVTCCYLNACRQLFCVPVSWTLIILGLFCICFLIFPFSNKNSRAFSFVSAFAGVGFFIAAYIILFGRQEYVIFIIANIVVILIIWPIIVLLNKVFDNKVGNALWFYGAFILTPYFLILQLVLLYKSLVTPLQKKAFIFSSVLILCLGLTLTFQVKRIFDKVGASADPEVELRSLIKNPVNNYLTELILGAHWKYHTELCCYDGWRPPFHDPVLVISNKVLFPFSHFGKDTRLYYNTDLYKKLYPGNPTDFSCRCAIRERLWDFPGF
ncbi:MAG: hypothetical protein ACXVPD_12300, partial [Bacteroidia bacterium]